MAGHGLVLLHVAASMGTNIILAAGKKRAEFNRIARRHHNPSTAHLPPAVIAKNIADDVIRLYLDRSQEGKLTGHWIVFAEHDRKNYYLCLATHEEGDDVIAEELRLGVARNSRSCRSACTPLANRPTRDTGSEETVVDTA